MRKISTVWFQLICGTLIALGALALVADLILYFSKSIIRNSTVTHSALIIGAVAIIQIFASALLLMSSLKHKHVPAESDAESAAANQNSRLAGMLRSTQEQSQIIIQSIDDGVIVFDTSGKITLINPAAATLTEWSVGDALGVDIQFVMKVAEENGKPFSSTENVFKQALDNKKHIAQTVQLTGHVSKQLIISLAVSPIMLPPNNEVVGAVAVMRDITKARQAEQERADFISTASHEMRTPVAAIEGYLALAMNEHVSEIDSRARGYLEKAHEATEHLGKLFQDLLTSAKVEDGLLSNHPAVIEVGEVLRRSAEVFRGPAQKKGLQLELNSSIDSNALSNAHSLQPLYFVQVDPDRLREVISNLLDNAIKYTDKGEIKILLDGDENTVHIAIKDTGRGIPAENVPHLFQKFYRVDNADTRAIGGTGLGLFISRKIIELCRGRSWVESQLGQGSTFHVSLPRLTTARAEQLRAEQTSQEVINHPQAATAIIPES